MEDLLEKLNELMILPAETEYIEFKEAKNNFDFDKLGKYFSALSNEANLKMQKYAWLIFGVSDKVPRKIVGTSFRNGSELQNLKEEIANHTTNNITFDEIYDLNTDKGRVVIFKILPAPQNIPIAWKGHYYGRDNEALVALNISEIEFIRNQEKKYDWSAIICERANLEDLDKEAIKKAREKYLEKHPKFKDDIDEWDDLTFLNKAKVTINGKITNTAIILLGKEESEHFISPSIAKMSWILKDENNIEVDYEHFGPPFINNVDNLFKKIRNLKYRYLPNGTIFPSEITQYDSYVIREALNNCIVHQDYELKGKINVVEKKDELIFSNLGSFLPGNVETVIYQDSPQEYYRNSFLANAMVNLDMIDTIGSGIKRMFSTQKKRFFPLPDYDLKDRNKVTVKILGKVLDENYTNLLMKNSNLDLNTVILLDKVQKRDKISKNEAKILRDNNLVEGRYPNLFISAGIAKITGNKETYIRNRGLDNEHYKQLIIEYLKKYGSANRKEIDDLILDKLPDILKEGQKETKVKNLLYDMSKKDNLIENTGSNRYPKWKLIK